MQITIDLPPDLEQGLRRSAAQSNIPLQVLILQALHQMIQPPSLFTPQRSEVILAYEGSPDFPAFETYREELVAPREPELF